MSTTPHTGVFRGTNQHTQQSLAGDLSKIAMGEMYSACRGKAWSACKRCETKGRIPLTHCRLALHGVRDTHHRLQDAAWLIAVADGVEAEYDKSIPYSEHPRWKAQVCGLQEVTKTMNATSNHTEGSS